MTWISITGELTTHSMGKAQYTVVRLPSRWESKPPFVGAATIRGEIELDGVAWEGAWQPRSGGWFLMVSRDKVKAAGLAVGGKVCLRFRIMDSDRVSEPELLQKALAEAPEWRAAWELWTPGKRRGLCHWIASARTEETGLRRVETVLLRLEDFRRGKETPIREITRLK